MYTMLETDCIAYAYISGTVNSLKTLTYIDEDLNNEDIRKICEYGNKVEKKCLKQLNRCSQTVTYRVRLPVRHSHRKVYKNNQIKGDKKMARVKMVTRTVEQTTAEIMELNVTTAEVAVKEYTIGGKYTDDELLKKFKKMYETDEVKLVHIVSQKTAELLLGMSEEEFIKLAKVLPSRNITKTEQ